MLALDPDDRPDMKEVCEALKNIVNGKPAHAAELKSTPKAPAPPAPPAKCAYKPGPQKNGKGAAVSSVEMPNAKKVKVTFSDGSKQIYDVGLALNMKYIVKA